MTTTVVYESKSRDEREETMKMGSGVCPKASASHNSWVVGGMSECWLCLMSLDGS